MNIFKALRQFTNQISFFRNFKLVNKSVLVTCLTLNLGVLVTEALGFASLYPLMTFIEKEQSIAEFAKVSDLHAFLLLIHNVVNVELTLASLMLVTFALVVLRQSLNYFASVFNEKLKWKVGVDLGRLVVGNTLASDSKYINNTHRGDFIVSCDYECQAAASVLSIHIMLFRASLSFLAYLAVVFLASPGPAFGSLLLFIVFSFSMSFLVKRAHQAGRLSVVVRRDFVNAISEIYGAWKTIKLYNTEELERDRYSQFGSKLVDVRVALTKISGLIELIFVPAVLAVLLSVTFLMIEGLHFSISVVLIYVATMVRLMPIAKEFHRRFAMLAQYDPSMSKVAKIINDARSNSECKDEGVTFSNFTSGIEFRDVSFAYDDCDTKVLKGVNVFLPKGGIISIVGRSGSGKSTLIDLITGIITPKNGQVLLDNIPLSSYSLTSVRRNIAVVTQETFLFHQSIRENLCYGIEAADEKIMSILRLVNLSEFVSSLPSGLDTIVADSAKNFSGGQKQRFAIARALIKNAPIVVLDEPTSALDSRTEKEVIRVLKGMAKKSKKTIIMVAHRQAAVEVSDMVISLVDGCATVELQK